VKSLQENQEAGNYTVTFDAVTQRITLTAAEQGGDPPVISGIRENTLATGASQTFALNNAIGDLTGEEIFGVTLGTVATQADVLAELNHATTGMADHVASFDDAGNLVITSKTPGAASPTVSTAPADIGTELTAVVGTNVAGTDLITDGIAVTRLPGVTGTYTTEVEAASHKFTLTYGTKSAEINIVGRDGSPHEVTNQLRLINDQLLAAGLHDVEASFDSNDQLIFSGKTEENKMLAVAGENSTIFGTATVSIGTPAISAYKSSNPVDQFVEEINRNPNTNTYLRASNDNGKLRIENLSTQDLSVVLDKDGDGVGAPTSHKIKGNAIRASLANEFNEAKNQLDRFADDASFNGINLLRGDNLRITFNESGNSFIEIQAKDGQGISANTLDMRQLNAIDLDSDDDIDALLNEVKLALSSVRTQASKFGSNLSIVQNRQQFTKQMINTLETGAANLTLADMNEEAANLLALQTRQSLSSSSLSLASQADQSVLQLLQ
jgi:flagellin